MKNTYQEFTWILTLNSVKMEERRWGKETTLENWNASKLQMGQTHFFLLTSKQQSDDNMGLVNGVVEDEIGGVSVIEIAS